MEDRYEFTFIDLDGCALKKNKDGSNALSWFVDALNADPNKFGAIYALTQRSPVSSLYFAMRSSESAVAQQISDLDWDPSNIKDPSQLYKSFRTRWEETGKQDDATAGSHAAKQAEFTCEYSGITSLNNIKQFQEIIPGGSEGELMSSQKWQTKIAEAITNATNHDDLFKAPDLEDKQSGYLKAIKKANGKPCLVTDDREANLADYAIMHEVARLWNDISEQAGIKTKCMEKFRELFYTNEECTESIDTALRFCEDQGNRDLLNNATTDFHVVNCDLKGLFNELATVNPKQGVQLSGTAMKTNENCNEYLALAIDLGGGNFLHQDLLSNNRAAELTSREIGKKKWDKIITHIAKAHTDVFKGSDLDTIQTLLTSNCEKARNAVFIFNESGAVSALNQNELSAFKAFIEANKLGQYQLAKAQVIIAKENKQADAGTRFKDMENAVGQLNLDELSKFKSFVNANKPNIQWRAQNVGFARRKINAIAKLTHTAGWHSKTWKRLDKAIKQREAQLKLSQRQAKTL